VPRKLEKVHPRLVLAFLLALLSIVKGRPCFLLLVVDTLVAVVQLDRRVEEALDACHIDLLLGKEYNTPWGSDMLDHIVLFALCLEATREC